MSMKNSGGPQGMNMIGGGGGSAWGNAVQGGANRMSSGSQNQGYGLQTTPIPGQAGATGGLNYNHVLAMLPMLSQMFGQQQGQGTNVQQQQGGQSMLGQNMGTQMSPFFGGGGGNAFGMGVSSPYLFGGAQQGQGQSQQGGGVQPNLASNFQTMYSNPAVTNQGYQPAFQYR